MVRWRSRLLDSSYRRIAGQLLWCSRLQRLPRYLPFFRLRIWFWPIFHVKHWTTSLNVNSFIHWTHLFVSIFDEFIDYMNSRIQWIQLCMIGKSFYMNSFIPTVTHEFIYSMNSFIWFGFKWIHLLNDFFYVRYSDMFHILFCYSVRHKQTKKGIICYGNTNTYW